MASSSGFTRTLRPSYLAIGLTGSLPLLFAIDTSPAALTKQVLSVRHKRKMGRDHVTDDQRLGWRLAISRRIRPSAGSSRVTVASGTFLSIDLRVVAAPRREASAGETELLLTGSLDSNILSSQTQVQGRCAPETDSPVALCHIGGRKTKSSTCCPSHTAAWHGPVKRQSVSMHRCAILTNPILSSNEARQRA